MGIFRLFVNRQLKAIFDTNFYEKYKNCQKINYFFFIKYFYKKINKLTIGCSHRKLSSLGI